jgi:hypothetical protein
MTVESKLLNKKKNPRFIACKNRLCGGGRAITGCPLFSSLVLILVRFTP